MGNRMGQKQQNFHFVHDEAANASWTQGLREVFEYRDLGIKSGTDNDFVAHVIRFKGKAEQDNIHQWHIHECRFQMVYILEGWVSFEYDGVGVRTLRKGDCIHQPPLIRHRELECSEDLEMLEIVSPADFKTKVVDGPD